LAAQYDRFAAVVAICGWGDPRRLAPHLKHLPVWLFHGAADPIVPVRCSQQMVRALKAAGAKDIRYTEYRDVGHESWDLAFSDPAMPEWLFAQSRAHVSVKPLDSRNLPSSWSWRRTGA
jgi:predicted peptidase